MKRITIEDIVDCIDEALEDYQEYLERIEEPTSADLLLMARFKECHWWLRALSNLYDATNKQALEKAVNDFAKVCRQYREDLAANPSACPEREENLLKNSNRFITAVQEIFPYSAAYLLGKFINQIVGESLEEEKEAAK